MNQDELRAQLAKKRFEDDPPPAAGLESLVRDFVREMRDAITPQELATTETLIGGYLDQFDSALTASAAPSGGVRVNPLLWIPSEGWRKGLTSWEAHPIAGVCYSVWASTVNDYRWRCNSTDASIVESIEVGKAAAEAHWNALVAGVIEHSAISSAPAAQQEPALTGKDLGSVGTLVDDLEAIIAFDFDESVPSVIDDSQGANVMAPAFIDYVTRLEGEYRTMLRASLDRLLRTPAWLASHATEATQPPASQDAAGEGVRWFAHPKPEQYYEVRDGVALYFSSIHRNGVQSTCSDQTIVNLSLTGRRGDRELTRADVDAIRASWQTPSPGVGA